jgi:hypothetical protein
LAIRPGLVSGTLTLRPRDRDPPTGTERLGMAGLEAHKKFAAADPDGARAAARIRRAVRGGIV